MAILPRTILLFGCLLLAACAEQPAEQKQAAALPKTEAATAAPAAESKSAPSNVHLSQETGHLTGSSYYVQNRVIASGGVISGALMGS